ncbi:MAG: hypothetical protein NVSMB32_09070 [Actinomycetota bacterium]
MLLAAALGALGTSPALRSRAKACRVLAAILPGVARPSTEQAQPQVRGVTVRRLALARGPADLYEGRGGAGAPGIVLIHGANIGGIDDPRVRRLAAALAGAGRTVLAPSLVLGERKLDLTDLGRIQDGIDALADRTGPVVVVAFSYGGALALCALAQRPAIQGRIRAVATVGTYFDLLHIIQGVTTGQIYLRGELHPWRPPEVAGEQALSLLASFLGGEDAAGIAGALSGGNPEALSRAARAVFAVIANRDPRRTADLAAALPPPIREVLRRISPAQQSAAIRVPLYALHSRVDPAAPALESEELVRAVRPRARARLTLVGGMRHVTPAAGLLRRLADLPGLLRFAASILREQEHWLPTRRIGHR